MIFFLHPPSGVHEPDLWIHYDLHNTWMIYIIIILITGQLDIQQQYIYQKQVNPDKDGCFSLKNKFREAFKYDVTHQ